MVRENDPSGAADIEHRLTLRLFLFEGTLEGSIKGGKYHPSEFGRIFWHGFLLDRTCSSWGFPAK
jgi:hypothetical protein